MGMTGPRPATLKPLCRELSANTNTDEAASSEPAATAIAISVRGDFT
jgi:hypothetical protein